MHAHRMVFLLVAASTFSDVGSVVQFSSVPPVSYVYVKLPTSARTLHTRFRIRQLNVDYYYKYKGSWALDDVHIGPLHEDFEFSPNNHLWAQLSGGTRKTATGCWQQLRGRYVYVFDGYPPRVAQTHDMNMTSEEAVEFLVTWESDHCYQPKNGQDIVLEYSVNRGWSWTKLAQKLASIVNVAPRILWFRRKKINPGQTAVFNCMVTGNPVPILRWINVQGPGKISKVHWTFIKGRNYQNVTFNIQLDREFKKEFYRCTANTTGGSDSKQAMVETFALPVLTTAPQVIARTQSSAIILWLPWKVSRDRGDPPISSYSVMYHTKRNPHWQQHGPIIAAQGCSTYCVYIAAGLQTGREYTFAIAVTRVGPRGTGPPGPPVQITTAQSGTLTPKIVHGLSNSTCVTLRWLPVKKEGIGGHTVESYTILYKRELHVNWTVHGHIAAAVCVTRCEYTVNGPLPFTLYEFAIRIVVNSSLGLSLLSSTVGKLTDCNDPASAPILSLGKSSPKDSAPREQLPVIRWELPAKSTWNCDYVQYMLIYTRELSGNSEKVEHVAPSIASKVVKSLLPEHKYAVQVAFSNNAGYTSPRSKIVILTGSNAAIYLVSRTQLMSEFVNGTNVVLRWAPWIAKQLPTQPIASYAIKFRLVKDTNWTTHGIMLPSKCGKFCVYDAGKLHPYRPYQFNLAAVGHSGDTLWGHYLAVVTDCADPAVGPRIEVFSAVDKYKQPKSNIERWFVRWQLPPKSSWNCKSVLHVLVYTRDGSTENVKQYTAFMTQGKVKYTVPGRSYTVQVAFVNNQGYISPRSLPRTLYVEAVRKVAKPHAGETYRQTDVSHLWGFFFLLLLLALIVVLGYLFVRRRKRQRRKAREECSVEFSREQHQATSGVQQESCSDVHLGAHGDATRPCRPSDTAVPLRGLGRYMSGTAGKIRIKEQFIKLQNSAPGNVSMSDTDGSPRKDKILSVAQTLDSEFSPLAGNFVDGYRRPHKYIAIKGPDSKSKAVFWDMVCRYNVDRIITLLTDSEDCDSYWADDCVPQYYHDIAVTLDRREMKTNWITRTFEVTKGSAGKALRVTQQHFIVWPEQGAPLAADVFQRFREEVLSRDSGDEDTPVIMHCSNGIGRTGMFLVLDYLLKEAQCEGSVDVATCVETLRKQHPGLIQTLEQYQCIYDTIYKLASSQSPPESESSCGKSGTTVAVRERVGNIYEDGQHENIYESIQGDRCPAGRTGTVSIDHACKM